ncbi:zinc finger protein DHHC domain containing protein, putative [Entamoeba invadens IP1]|uniref:Palmitoyltransferase n=1 Tax=Entamoeba invadens IP1 TaxID=370355 RepID=A0A0A1U0A4_ENTIV|nr:zinc finger protein DHHC domain containing protein, putative [Entamoeba invadens IP1]ELP84318.1 zinc finger protein DHHC domain containing protein, putative [Entamoeba invadens IP1]|eukprot:XP_004183664.1 zinc finger protein DHHC domain containing protein, putative [Entamoeba invadens IP1]
MRTSENTHDITRIINSCIIIFTVISVISAVFIFEVVIFPQFHYSVIQCTFHYFIHFYLVYSLLYFYFKAVFSTPSVQPELFNRLFPDYLKECGDRYCDICKANKPLRTHHCNTCKQCIGRYDHHCLLICNCIGDNTMRLFFNTILYFFIGSLYIIGMLTVLYYKTNFTDFEFITIGCICCLFGIAIAIVIAMGCYLAFYIFLINDNQTTVEVLAEISNKQRVLDYNRGLYNNWKEVMLLNLDYPFIVAFLPIDLSRFVKNNKIY